LSYEQVDQQSSLQVTINYLALASIDFEQKTALVKLDQMTHTVYMFEYENREICIIENMHVMINQSSGSTASNFISMGEMNKE
jgi:hypothetical protein